MRLLPPSLEVGHSSKIYMPGPGNGLKTCEEAPTIPHFTPPHIPTVNVLVPTLSQKDF